MLSNGTEYQHALEENARPKGQWEINLAKLDIDIYNKQNYEVVNSWQLFDLGNEIEKDIFYFVNSKAKTNDSESP